MKETLKTLARHAHATNSDASTVHLVAVSAQRSAKVQVRLQASQRRKKGTVKTQAYNTPATKPDASPVQPVEDSAWETVKAQARHSPATSTIFSTIHPAADSAWKNLKAESVPVRDTSDKVIIQDGRSDPAAHSFEEVRLADAVFVWPREVIQMRRRVKRAWEGVLLLLSERVRSRVFIQLVARPEQSSLVPRSRF